MLGQAVVNGLIAGSGYGLFALGFGLIFQVGRFFNLAHGGVYAAGAYLAYELLERLGLNIWVGILLAIFGTSLLGALTYEAIYRPLYAKKASGLVLLLASLGVLIVIQNTISLYFGDATRKLRSADPIPGMYFFSAFVTSVQVLTFFTSTAIALLMWIWIEKTHYGKQIRAIANDAELSDSIGLDRAKVIFVCFALGSGVAGLGAILSAFDTDLNPTMGFRVMLFGICAVIVGGVGNIKGAFFGGLLVGLSQHVAILRLSTRWQDTITFIIMIVVLLARPNGFWGKPSSQAQI